VGLVDVPPKYFDVRQEDMTVGKTAGMAGILRIVVAYGLEDSKDFARLDSCFVDKASKLVGITVVT
jgi:hypothetical protein